MEQKKSLESDESLKQTFKKNDTMQIRDGGVDVSASSHGDKHSYS